MGMLDTEPWQCPHGGCSHMLGSASSPPFLPGKPGYLAVSQGMASSLGGRVSLRHGLLGRLRSGLCSSLWDIIKANHLGLSFPPV